jgi:hypothetical protein
MISQFLIEPIKQCTQLPYLIPNSNTSVLHSAGYASVTDFIGLHNTISAIYREFNIVHHVPYTDYHINFKYGRFNLHLNDTSSSVGFYIEHNNDINSFIVSKNKLVDTYNGDKYTGVLLNHNIKEGEKYKIFLQIHHGNVENDTATYYHAFFGSTHNSDWYYLATLCRYGTHNIGQTSGGISNKKYNGHLCIRSFKYGSGWYYDELFNSYPIEKINNGNNNSTNSNISYSTPDFMAEIKLGGGISQQHIDTFLYKNRQTDKSPTVPLNFIDPSTYIPYI